MRCTAHILRYKKTGKIGFSVPSNIDMEFFLLHLTPKQKDRLDLTCILTCGGNIIAQIGCHDEPYYGGTYAEIDIKFVCETCKQFYFPELPNSLEQLNKWITEKIKEQ